MLDLNIKLAKENPENKRTPKTIEQLIQKYKLDSLWTNIVKIVNEVVEQSTKDINADRIKTGTLSADRIKGGSLILGGENDTNGSLQVKDSNNENIFDVTKDGIVLGEDTLIGNNGVLSNLTFEEMNWKLLGFSIFEPLNPEYVCIDIGAYIPENFIIKKAYLTIQLHPVNFTYINETQVGYSQNINLYYEKMESGIINPINVDLGSEEYDYRYINNNTNVLNCSGTATELKTFTDIDITDFIESGKATLFQLRTSINGNDFTDVSFGTSDYSKAKASRTGYARAMINVYGYLK